MKQTASQVGNCRRRLFSPLHHTTWRRTTLLGTVKGKTHTVGERSTRYVSCSCFFGSGLSNIIAERGVW